MEELKYKAALFERYDCIETLDGVFKSDNIISENLRFALKMAVTPLEDVQEDEKDWHPTSHKKVLDLVHPSIYPLVYGQSRILNDGICQLDDCIRRCRDGQLELLASGKPGDEKRLGSEWSNRFQWLPSEFDLPPGTQDVKAMSYINNLHPEQHKNLYTIIELVIAKAISLWNLTLTCVMTDLNSKPRIVMRDGKPRQYPLFMMAGASKRIGPDIGHGLLRGQSSSLSREIFILRNGVCTISNK